MAQQNFINGYQESVTTIASASVKAAEQTSNSATLELVAPGSAAPTLSADALTNAVIAAGRNSLNASNLLRAFARTASPVQAILANLVRANAALKTVAASLNSAQSMKPAAAEKFLVRLGLHLIASEAEATIEPAQASRLLALAGVEMVGALKESAARAIAADAAYTTEFQSLVVASAVQAGSLVNAENAGAALSLRARLGYAGPRHQRRASTRRPRAAVRAAERALAVVGVAQ